MYKLAGWGGGVETTPTTAKKYDLLSLFLFTSYVVALAVNGRTRTVTYEAES